VTARRRAIVTGANRGLGFAVSAGLAEAGLSVVLTGRSVTSVEAAASTLRARGHDVLPRELDVVSDDSVRSFVEWVRDHLGAVDVLVNNAGVSLEGFDLAVVEETLAANVRGPVALTDALVPCLAPGSTVVMVSSGMGELACVGAELQAQLRDPELSRETLEALLHSFASAVADGSARQQGWPPNAYRVSKLALNAFTRILARELDGRVCVCAVCPGWVRTRMGGGDADRSVEEGASGILQVALADGSAPTGAFLRDGRAIDW